MLIGGTALRLGPCLHVERPVAVGDSNARHSYLNKPKPLSLKKAFDRLVAFS